MVDSKFSQELFETVAEHAQKVAVSPLIEKMYSSEFRTLWLINKAKGPVLPSELAKELNVTTPRVTVILNNLYKEGCIERNIDTDDRRKVNVTLTSKGKSFIQKYVDSAMERLLFLLDKAGKEDSEAVLRFLKLCNDSLE